MKVRSICRLYHRKEKVIQILDSLLHTLLRGDVYIDDINEVDNR